MWPDFLDPTTIDWSGQSNSPDALISDTTYTVLDESGNYSRGDLETRGAFRLPKKSLPEKLNDLITATPSTAIVAALVVLAVILVLKR